MIFNVCCSDLLYWRTNIFKYIVSASIPKSSRERCERSAHEPNQGCNLQHCEFSEFIYPHACRSSRKLCFMDYIGLPVFSVKHMILKTHHFYEQTHNVFLGINSPVAPEARHLLSALQRLPAKHPLQRRSVTLAAHQLLTEAGSTLVFEGKPSTKHGWERLHLQLLDMRILRFLLLVSYVLFCSISTPKKELKRNYYSDLWWICGR